MCLWSIRVMKRLRDLAEFAFRKQMSAQRNRLEVNRTGPPLPTLASPERLTSVLD